MFFDVSFERDESRVNEIRDLLVGIRLSFQLSTCASSRRRREIDQQGLVFGLCLLQRGVVVFDPINEH
jgi:hypothetical protein